MKKFKIAKPIYLAVASLVYMILNDAHIINLAPDKFDSYVNMVAMILMGVGIMVSPTVELPVEEEIKVEE